MERTAIGHTGAVGVSEANLHTSSSGLEARIAAVNAIGLVFSRGSFLESALDQFSDGISEPRDRAFAHALAATALRHKGQIEQVLEAFVERPLGKTAGRTKDILLCGAAQLLFLATEPHAAINTSLHLADLDPATKRHKGLINAILRRVSDNRDAILKDLPPAITSLPSWLQRKLRADLGPQQAEACAEALLTRASLDLSLKDDSFRQPLEEAGGASLPTGTARFLAPYPAVSSLPGYDRGGWWVQDAAAALPARMLGDVRGKTVLDMCAAPGGKTLQLAAAGASVTALDVSESRLELVHQNLARTGLSAASIAADVMDFQPADKFDAILLDAPCSATGTIRRHPELPWLRHADDITQLVRLQRNLLRKAASLLNPGGVLVYAVCSLLAEEGSKQVQAFLNENRNFQRSPDPLTDMGLTPEFLTKKGDLRTLPHFSLGSHAGMDGFYAACLVQVAD